MTTINRTVINAWIDDDGSNTTGELISKSDFIGGLLDPIDVALAALDAVAATKAPLIPRVTGTTSSATPTPNADTTDLYSLTAQAAAAAFVTPTGTPVNGQRLIVRIKDNGTARALTWSSGYVGGGAALPSTTVLSKILTIQFLYNTDNALNKWQCVWVAQEDAVAGGVSGSVRCHATGGAQSIANASYVAIQFPNDTLNVGAAHSTSVNNSRFTAPVTGDYRIVCSTTWVANATGQRILKLVKNGSTDLPGGGAAMAAASASYGAVITTPTVIVTLTAGDYVEAHGFQDSGGALTAGNGAPFVSSFMFERVG